MNLIHALDAERPVPPASPRRARVAPPLPGLLLTVVIAASSAAPVAGHGGGLQGATTTIEYVAHASFIVRSPGGVEILIDPYASRVWLGYDFPGGLAPDAILITHPHYDHDGGRFRGAEVWWDEDVRVIDAPGVHRIGDASVLGISGKHADPYGKEFGQRNTVMIIEVGGLRLAHVGDNGPLTPDVVRAMGDVDLLMLPIDAEEHILSNEAVAAAISAVDPAIVVPMHYRIPELEASADSPSDLGDIDPWLAGRDNVVRLETNRLDLRRGDVPAEPTVIVFRHSPAIRTGSREPAAASRSVANRSAAGRSAASGQSPDDRTSELEPQAGRDAEMGLGVIAVAGQ